MKEKKTITKKGNHTPSPIKSSSTTHQTRKKVYKINRRGEGKGLNWWYKNGDKGKQHYATAHGKAENQNLCFHVDFIIRMKNGHIYLFDTKVPEAIRWHMRSIMRY